MIRSPQIELSAPIDELWPEVCPHACSATYGGCPPCANQKSAPLPDWLRALVA